MKRLTEGQKKRLSIEDKIRYADLLCERLDILKHGSKEDMERIDRAIKKFQKENAA